MIEEILEWCDSMIEKYNINEDDVYDLQDILNSVNEDDFNGTEYREDEDIAEEE